MALTPIKKWKYPIVVNEKNQSGTNRYHEALMLAQTGFYPVSVNKLVHGGIHFDANVLGNLGVVVDKPSKVHCIADGEVVAYRVNDNYQKLDYGDKVGFYSTGFVLVRHLLEMERIEEATPATTPTTTEGQASTEADANNSTENLTAPAANALPLSNTAPATTTPATTESTTTQTTSTDTNTPTTPTTTGESSTVSTPPATETAKPKQPGHQLYFYSLYMHLADTKFYDDNPTEPAPAFWEQDIYRVIDKGLDFVEGLNIRKSPDSKKGEILAVLQAGTKVELHLDLHTENYKWYAVKSFTEGYSSIPPLTPYKHEGKEILGWVFNHTKIQLTESVFDIKGKDSKLAKSKGLRVRDESKKNILSMLPKGTQIKISGTKKTKTFVELAEIVRDGKPTIPLQEGKKMVWYDSLENVIRGKKYNEVVVLDKPYPIKAGDLVGHIGHNQNKGISKQKDKDGNYIEMATLPLKTGLTASQYKPSLHVECFTCEDLPTFITQTQTEASKIPDEDKTLVGICKGAKLLASPSKSDTTVGQVLKDTKIKVLSKQVNINWLQIEINTSETETKRLWVENSEKIAEKAKLEGDIELAEATPAWSQHPLQQSELTGSQNVVQMPMILSLNDEAYQAKQTRAVDDKGTLWILIQKDALGSKNLPVLGWAAIGSEGVKNVSCWDWFDFKEIIETSSLKEFYLSAKKAETRNKDNASLEQYKPTIKATLTILDKQYTNNECAALTTDCFNKISEKPALTTALGRLLVNYQSEWYAEQNTEGKRPEWEELNSEMTDDAENYLGYIKNGDEAKRDAYVSKQDESKQESIKQGLEQQRKDYQRFPPDYKDAPDKKLTSEQLRLYGKIQELEKKLIIWENTKEKATKMLWWDDVAKGLAKQSQQTKQSNTEKDKTEDSSKQQAETSSTPANLSQNGRAWFMHPVSMINYFSDNKILFQKGDKDEIIREINIRLAGFGGNVPTDEFTERTENMIKQFQRDYMKVEETGVVDMQVIEAIDTFQEEYPIETYFAQAKCKCSTYKKLKGPKCGGFGLGRYSEQKQKKDPKEKRRKYEYPGLHRTLFWVLRAWQFYLTHFDQRNMRIEKVASGYRCWSDNKFHNDRQTTNHMGKALDIHMVYNNPKITKANLCDDAREVMINYCDAHYRWGTPNVISLEAGNRVKTPGELAVASTWVHFDVRSFELDYLKDEYFAQSVEQVNGASMQTLITNKG